MNTDDVAAFQRKCPARPPSKLDLEMSVEDAAIAAEVACLTARALGLENSPSDPLSEEEVGVLLWTLYEAAARTKATASIFQELSHLGLALPHEAAIDDHRQT